MTIGPANSDRAVAALQAIKRLRGEETSAQQVLERIVQRLLDVVDVDAFFAGATDPDTGLFLGVAVAQNFDERACQPFWEHEFLIPDYNKFGDLGAADPVGDLRQATGGKLDRSPRYRMLHAIADYEDELRVSWRADGRPWGNLQLNRRPGSRPFTEEDRAFLRAAAPLAGAALRRAMLDEPAPVDPARGPGVLVLSPEGAIISATAEAATWLRELAGESPGDELGVNDVGVNSVRLLVSSLSSLHESSSRTRRTRVRTRHGTWLTVHASPLGDSGQVAMVIEPAKASEIAPIGVEAYQLTPREVQVTRLVARGLGTDEVAATLFLSRHTVRDHLKAIFEKVRVSSRGELTAKLFVEHYHEPFADAVAASSERVAQTVELSTGK